MFGVAARWRVDDGGHSGLWSDQSDAETNGRDGRDGPEGSEGPGTVRNQGVFENDSNWG